MSCRYDFQWGKDLLKTLTAWWLLLIKILHWFVRWWILIAHFILTVFAFERHPGVHRDVVILEADELMIRNPLNVRGGHRKLINDHYLWKPPKEIYWGNILQFLKSSRPQVSHVVNELMTEYCQNLPWRITWPWPGQWRGENRQKTKEDMDQWHDEMEDSEGGKGW